VKDHTEHLQRHTAILVDIAEDIRRELTSFGITISKVADQAATDKQEIQLIATQLFGIMGNGKKDVNINTGTIEGDGESDDLFEASSGKQKEAESAETPKAPEAPLRKHTKPFAMPLALIYTIDDAYLCCCPRCEPEAADLMMDNARRMVWQEQVNAIEEGTRREMVDAYKKQYLADAQAQAKQEAYDYATTAEGQASLAKLKDELREEVRVDLEATHLPALNKQGKDELLAQMARLT
jgi:hypothetical protein